MAKLQRTRLACGIRCELPQNNYNIAIGLVLQGDEDDDDAQDDEGHLSKIADFRRGGTTHPATAGPQGANIALHCNGSNASRGLAGAKAALQKAASLGKDAVQQVARLGGAALDGGGGIAGGGSSGSGGNGRVAGQSGERHRRSGSMERAGGGALSSLADIEEVCY